MSSDYEAARAAVAGGDDPHQLAAELVAVLTEDELLWCLDGDAPFWAGLTDLGSGGYHRSPFHAAVVERVGLPGFSFSDGPRGVVVGGATCFPVSMARGATWDTDLEERVGEVIGRELRAVGADLFGGVCVNILRHPAWGRAQETYGEDPHHVGEMGAALVRGVQRHAMACVKHFAVNSMENARFSVDISVDEVALHEVYLPHFRRVVDEGVAVVMSAYNSVNREWCGDSRTLLTDILRDEWGFRGFVISDWIFGMRDAAASVHAGLDVEMPYRMMRAQHLATAIEAGEVTWDEVRRSVTRTVSTLLRFDPVVSTPAPPRDVLASPEHLALAREVAARSVVLLRNEEIDGEPVLPLDPATIRSIAVVGELADVVDLGDGGSSDVWAPDVVTPLEGIRRAFTASTVTHDPGSDIGLAARLAAGAEVALVVVGYTYLDEGEFIGGAGTTHLAELMPPGDDPAVAAAYAARLERFPAVEPPRHVRERATSAGFATGGDRTSVRLHDHDVELIRAVVAANPRTVVTLVAGSAVVISEWDREVPAIAQSWYAGAAGGHGLADVLSGAVDAGGRLPFSVPVDEADLPAFERDATAFRYDRWHGWWHLERTGRPAAYPFGSGLSYGATVWNDVGIRAGDSGIDVTVTIHNTGGRDTSEVVQVYARRVSGGSIGPSRLIGFRRVEIEAGSAASVPWTVPWTSLAERDTVAHRMVVRPGDYEVRIARHAEDPGTTARINRAPDS